ncbi:MAG: HD domain-containing phosphohydrolase [Pseudomonadota bacterium]
MTQDTRIRTAPDWMAARRLDRIHSGLFLFVYGFYAYQICPILEAAPLWQLLAPVAALFVVKDAASAWFRRAATALPLERAVRRLFASDFGAYLFLGVLVALYNWQVFGSPLENGAKVLFAYTVLGFYAALDLTFEREAQLAEQLRGEGRSFPLSARFLPYQSKFALFSMLNIIVVSFVVTIVVLKDLIWFSETTIDHERAQLLIMVELLFILVVLGAYILRVIRQYARKMELALSDERDGLARVAAGDLKSRVPISANDEFGRIAALTNDMIARLDGALEEVERTRDVTIKALVSLSARRDSETGRHLLRTQLYVERLAREIADTPRYRGVVDEAFIRRLKASAPLHDIGKVGVPDAVLTKPGRLSDEEFAVMKTHAAIGAQALAEADEALGGSSFLETAQEIALSHHERWDGAGYPDGLAGEEIPLSARLMAIADVYDALRSKRVYKPRMTHEQAASIIAEGRGSHFDPDLVDAFLRVETVFDEIARRHDDAEDDHQGAAVA